MLLLSFIAINISAQTHRFIYEVNFKKDSTENSVTKDYYHLDISSKEMQFYGRGYHETDSLITHNIGFAEGNMPKFSTIILHSFNSTEYTEIEALEFMSIKQIDEPKQSWTLINEKKKYDIYAVQKAETNWSGRKWTAWFASEIPFQVGPQKFHGLPGLIVELYDSNKNYDFKLVKSNLLKDNLKSPLPEFMLSTAIAMNREKYVKTKLNFYQDPLSFASNDFMTMTDDNWAIISDGTKVTKANFKEVREIQQRNIKKYNNPIELDKIIQYPNK